MAKRFISTDIFDDEWFMELKPTSKLLWIYFITKCDHAGIMTFNERLCKFQTGLNDVQGCLTDLESRLYKISNTQYFIPKFIYFQYPDFPNSKVNQQKGAIKILEKFGLIIDNQLINLTTSNDVESLSKTYGNDNGNDNVISIIKEKTEFEKFNIWLKENCSLVCKIKDQITEQQFEKLRQSYSGKKIADTLLQMQNYKGIEKKYTSVYLTLNKWIKNDKSTSIIERNNDAARIVAERLVGGTDF